MTFVRRHMLQKRWFKPENFPLNLSVVRGGLINLNVSGFSIQYAKVVAVDVYWLFDSMIRLHRRKARLRLPLRYNWTACSICLVSYFESHGESSETSMQPSNRSAIIPVTLSNHSNMRNVTAIMAITEPSTVKKPMSPRKPFGGCCNPQNKSANPIIDNRQNRMRSNKLCDSCWLMGQAIKAAMMKLSGTE